MAMVIPHRGTSADLLLSTMAMGTTTMETVTRCTMATVRTGMERTQGRTRSHSPRTATATANTRNDHETTATHASGGSAAGGASSFPELLHGRVRMFDASTARRLPA